MAACLGAGDDQDVDTGRGVLDGMLPGTGQRTDQDIVRARSLHDRLRRHAERVDEKFDRVHAGVTMARQPDKKLQAEVKKRLTTVLGMEVIPHFREDPGVLGGVIVRVGDRVMDGSIRRRMKVLRRKMLSG